ncbi:hypothetical protein IWW50_005701, partial [Coemansia erecta]
MTSGLVVTPQSPQSPTAKVEDGAPVLATATSAGTTTADELTPAEREDMISEAEWGFRNWLREAGPRMGYV